MLGEEEVLIVVPGEVEPEDSPLGGLVVDPHPSEGLVLLLEYHGCHQQSLAGCLEHEVVTPYAILGHVPEVLVESHLDSTPEWEEWHKVLRMGPYPLHCPAPDLCMEHGLGIGPGKGNEHAVAITLCPVGLEGRRGGIELGDLGDIDPSDSRGWWKGSELYVSLSHTQPTLLTVGGILNRTCLVTLRGGSGGLGWLSVETFRNLHCPWLAGCIQHSRGAHVLAAPTGQTIRRLEPG